jgi:hypothetical protein
MAGYIGAARALRKDAIGEFHRSFRNKRAFRAPEISWIKPENHGGRLLTPCLARAAASLLMMRGLTRGPADAGMTNASR